MLQLPATYTQPLCADFTTQGDWLLEVVDMVWRTPESPDGIELDDWQRWVVRHVLETFPPGHKRAGELRYRQVLISMARQQGKSVLGAIFGLYGLLRAPGATVIGVASNASQARIIFDRTMMVIVSNPTLKKRFTRLAETRGIKSIDGSVYEIRASKGSVIQGIPLNLGLVDEIHITRPEIWNAMVSGTAASKNGIVIGVTTAGDTDSELLKDLYATGAKAASGDPSLTRFGAFVWEASQSEVPKGDDELGVLLMEAGPAYASGRLDLETAISDVRTLPPEDITRYRLNRFVDSTSSFISLDLWGRCAGEVPHMTRPVFCVDTTPEKQYASITASQIINGVTYTELVASLCRPSLEQLVTLCTKLSVHDPAQYVMDRYANKQLGDEMIRRGFKVTLATQSEMVNASSSLYSKISHRELIHAGDPLLSQQMPLTKRKNIGESFRISRQDSSVNIDAVLATALGCYFAEEIPDDVLQLFL